jgi:mono/diheme cytochrome c family protein
MKTAATSAAVFIPGTVFAVAGPGSLKKQAEAMEAAEREKAKAAADANGSATGAPTSDPSSAPAPAPRPAAGTSQPASDAAAPSSTSGSIPGSTLAQDASAPKEPTPPDTVYANGKNYDPGLASKGRRLYQAFCQKCHGLNLVNNSPAFFDLRKLRIDEKPRFYRSVSLGLRAMPAWGEVIKPDEMEQLWSYIMTTNKQ